MIVLLYVIVAILVLVLLFVGLLSLRYFRDISRANNQWSSFIPKRLTDIGSVKQLVITPLIDWYPAKESLVGKLAFHILSKLITPESFSMLGLTVPMSTLRHFYAI